MTKTKKKITIEKLRPRHSLCNLCGTVDVEDLQITQYPYKAKKKPVRVENVIVGIIECIDKGEPEYLLIQRSEKGNEIENDSIVCYFS